jgi:hypothetical protein
MNAFSISAEDIEQSKCLCKCYMNAFSISAGDIEQSKCFM